MSLITIHWRAPPKGGDFLYVVVYMRRALALCSLHDEEEEEEEEEEYS